jgi:predicted PurR-regulated permease PerM
VLFGFTLVTLFFLFREGPRLAEKLLYASRRLFGPEAEPVARQMVASIHGTVDGLVLVGLGVGAVLGVGYAIVGAPHPALLGAATAVAAVVPMGAPIVLAIAALLVLAAGKTVAAAILFGAGMVLIFIADHAIRPALIGGTTRLPFLWVLLGILGGVETFGLLGLFLGPAVMAALILLWREWTGDATNPSSE